MSEEAAASEKPTKTPKVTMREPPVAPKPDPAKKTAEATDALGRVIEVRKINALMRYDLAKLVGSDYIANAGVMGPASLAFSVTKIDGMPVFPPATEDELRVIIQRLDDEGIAAIADAYLKAGWVEAEVDGTALKN